MEASRHDIYSRVRPLRHFIYKQARSLSLPQGPTETHGWMYFSGGQQELTESTLYSSISVTLSTR
jgi:hypothetical protein